MAESEASLIQQAKAGDPTAFIEIYDRFYPTIYRYIYLRLGNVPAAEDLTSEVFVRLVEHIDGFAYRGRPLLAWLYTIARNLVADYHRRVDLRQQCALDETLEDTSSEPGATVEARVARQRLIAAMAHLTETQRLVIQLKFFEGLDNAVIAQVLDKSVGAVKSLQHRALVALRQVLEED